MRARKLIQTITGMIIALNITGCSSPNESRPVFPEITTSHRSVSFNERIRYIIVHYTALDDKDSLDILTKGQVSAHYLIPKETRSHNNRAIIYKLVPDEKRAWHAGKSEWNGRSNLNDTSLGIEIVNAGFTEDPDGHKTWYEYDETQIKSLISLLKNLMSKYSIPPENVLGHSDIAPLRKSDPGKLFPWNELARNDIGAWPDSETVEKYLAGRSPYSTGDVKTLQKALYQFGFTETPQNGIVDETTKKIITAFQLHYRQSNTEGFPDAETEALALALVEKYRR